MPIGFAYAYARILLVLTAILFALALVLHLGVLFHVNQSWLKFIPWMFHLIVFVNLLVTPFLRDHLRWMDQVKACPKWLWKSALGAALYSFSTFVVLMFSGNMSLWNYASTGFPLGFDALCFCIIYAAICKNYLSGPEVSRKALYSAGFGILTLVLFTLGSYFHPHEIRYSNQLNGQ
jgi:hypothetical protein